MITFERGRSGISHLRQSSCYPMSSIKFINISMFAKVFAVSKLKQKQRWQNFDDQATDKIEAWIYIAIDIIVIILSL